MGEKGDIHNKRRIDWNKLAIEVHEALERRNKKHKTNFSNFFITLLPSKIRSRYVFVGA